MISIEANSSEINRLLKQLEHVPQKLEKASRTAINSTLSEAKKRIPGIVTKRYTIAKKEVSKTLSISRAHNGKNYYTKGNIYSTADCGTPLGKFKTSTRWSRRKSSKRGLPARRKILSVSIIKGKTTVTPWFVATMKSGHKGVYDRRSASRLPIREHYGPSVPTMIGKEFEPLQRDLERYHTEKLESELNEILENL